MTGLFLSILGISLSAGLVIAGLMLIAPLLNRRYAAKWKYWIWILLAIRLLIPFDVGIRPIGVNTMLQTPRRKAVEAVVPAAPLPEERMTELIREGTVAPPQIIVEIPAQAAAPIVSQPDKNNASISWLELAVLIWLTGALSFIAFHLLSYMHFRRRVADEGRFPEDEYIREQVLRLSEELKIKSPISLAVYSKAASPMVIGLLRPVLVLPDQRCSAEEMYFVLKHELIHLRRHDIFFKLLFVVVNGIHWFNPLVWIMRSEAVMDMEMACDEKVVQEAAYAVRKAYTEALLSTIHRGARGEAALSTQFSGGKQLMKKRFKNILTGLDKKNGFFLLMLVLVLTIGLGSWIGCSIAEAGQPPENTPQSGSSSYAALAITGESRENEGYTPLRNPENIDGVRKGLMHTTFMDIQNAYAVYAFEEHKYVVRYTWDGGKSWDKMIISCSNPPAEQIGEPIYLEEFYFTGGSEDTVWRKVTAKYGEFPQVYLSQGKYLSYSDLRVERRN